MNLNPKIDRIPFNLPFTTGKEMEYIKQAIATEKLSGNGKFTKKCQAWLESRIGCQKALLTHSCTAALEMTALLADIQPGDEVIMPSYTFVSTANAFVLRGGVPVFVDIRPDTLNLDETKIEQAITERTRAIVPVHYAGVSCEMDTIMEIARKHNLLVIEDAAQGMVSRYKGKPLGSIGHLAAVSFHDTKNIISGEGGALLINDPELIERAEIIWEKGTNRSQFFRGEVDKYSWVDVGSSYLPSEINAAFLWAQLELAEGITRKRLSTWRYYHQVFKKLEYEEILHCPIIPDDCQHNGHMYYLLLEDLATRTALIEQLKREGISAVFHYVPLHDSVAGQKFGRVVGEMKVTNDIADRLLRLPMFADIRESQMYGVSNIIEEFFAAYSHTSSDRNIFNSNNLNNLNVDVA
ncbi:TDP-4-oxo-6-deoxy-D-glucose transaminase [Hyella patelloides LEGE 07179]|uniref:TDP-4-oxo-6-deoxy-D-glucose transaminase n=1 Tax=Hyella patelloides LEGE 07179 TaxID=945734 RepID=A0A563VII6_9CYAN|nr:dTDP-4-amino-4,6-dideoxygalactose transaminase [Hyella patelloides]VEP11246.1 TDP-4-oxo-6-deoxy-D-glucose transaminase [Hyella patelloides LEGE 07179]